MFQITTLNDSEKAHVINIERNAKIKKLNDKCSDLANYIKSLDNNFIFLINPKSGGSKSVFKYF